MIFFILIFIILFSFLSYRRLDWAVMFLIATLPAYLIRFNILGIPSTLFEAMILISFGAWFVTNFNELKTNLANLFKRNNKKIKIDYPFRHEIVLMLVISFIAAGISGFSNEALGIWKAYFFEPALFFILVLNVFKTKEDIKKILWPLAVSALAVSAVAVYQKITGNFIVQEFCENGDNCRITSFFGYPNAVGLYLGPVVLILAGWFSSVIARSVSDEAIPSQRARQRLLRLTRNDKIVLFFSAITVILSLLAIYFAKSEGALIGIIAGLVVFGIFAGKKIRWITVGLIVLAAAGIMAFAPAREYAVNPVKSNSFVGGFMPLTIINLLPSTMPETLFNGVNKILLRDLSGQIRKAQWAETWGMLKDGRLFLGAGLANYQNAIRPYHKEGIFIRDYNDPDWHRKTVFNEEYREKAWQPLEVYLYPHNIILNFWSELGIAGMLLFVWIIGKFFYVGLKIIENCKLPARNALACEAGGKIKNSEQENSQYFVVGLMGAITVIIVHGMVDVPYFKNDLAVMFWLIVAMIGIIKIQHDLNN